MTAEAKIRTPALAGLRFSLAGPGRVGESLAAWLVAAGARLVSVAGSPAGGRAAAVARRLGGEARELENLGGGEDLLLVAVADPALDAVARALGGRRRAAVALHTAGSRDASALAPLAAGGAAVGTLHPLKAFPRPLTDPAAAAGTLFAVDGDPEALVLAARLAAALGAETARVPAEARLLYHFAATLAAGGVVTLVAAAAALAGELGLPPSLTRGYLQLARGALDAAAEAGGDPAAAITGPLARGDVATVASQLEDLAHRAPTTLPIALALGRETLRQVRRLGPLSAGQEALAARFEAGLEKGSERFPLP